MRAAVRKSATRATASSRPHATGLVPTSPKARPTSQWADDHLWETHQRISEATVFLQEVEPLELVAQAATALSSLQLALDRWMLRMGGRPAWEVAQPRSPASVADLLLDTWVEETGHAASLSSLQRHWAYQVLAALGQRQSREVVPLVVERMRQSPGPRWFLLLREISGTDTAFGETTVAGAAEKWADWAIDAGYVGEPSTTPSSI